MLVLYMQRRQKGFTFILLPLIILFVVAGGYFLYRNYNQTNSDLLIKPSQNESLPKTTVLRDTPAGWTNYTTKDPLAITFQIPKSFSIKTDSQSEVVINSSDGYEMYLCTGCMLNTSIARCGNQSGPDEEFKCDISNKKVISDHASYSVYTFKDSQKFAEIVGVVYKEDGTDLPLSITSSDNRTPTTEDFSVFDTILTSIRDSH